MKVIYWSGTGNTEEMANLISEGISKAGKDVEVFNISEKADEAKDAIINNKDEVFGFGCPAMGDEVLEEGEFEPFFEEISSELKGKKVFLFGSYGWGDGQWMRDWEEKVEGLGATVITEALISNYAIDDKEEAIGYGEKVVSLL